MCVSCAQSSIAAAESVGLDPLTSKVIAISAATVMLFGVVTPLVNPTTQVKAGAVCVKPNQKVVKGEKTFVCKKSGKKLIWKVRNKNVSQPSTTTPKEPDQKPAEQIQYQNPSIPSKNVELCKIREVSNSRGMTGAGFPAFNSMTPRFGTVKWALIPIDFPDLPGESNFKPRVTDQMALLSDWFENVSDGKFKVEWVLHDSWVRLPKPSTQYSIERSVNLRDAPNGEKLWTDAIQASDPEFNFSNIQTVNFLLPKGQTFITETSQGFPWDEAVSRLSTAEGRIASFATPGVFMDHPQAEYWSYWAHEFGHAIGLPHVGSSRGQLPPFNPFDLMGGQDGPTRDLSGWLRFIAQWLPDENVYCLPAADINTLELTLVPLIERKSGVRLAILPTSTTKAIMIESRRSSKFSCGPKDKNGVLVYEYDAQLGHGENFLIPIVPSDRTKQSVPGCRVEPFADPLLYQGNKLTIAGLTIEVVKVANLDQIRITKG